MPARLFLSSGDLVADRRYDLRRDLQLRGDLPAAARSLAAGDRARAELCLGLVHAGRNPRAARRTRRRDRGLSKGARRRSVRSARFQFAFDAARRRPLSGMPQAYVQVLFDQYAPRFESSLVDNLGYRGPALLFKAVLSVRSAARKPAFFRALHRSRLRHGSGRRRLCKRGRSFHRH